MALSQRDIVITPNRGASTEPLIKFTGADATSSATITLRVINSSTVGTLSFEGASGQLLSITDSMVGTIFSANDVSGIPSIEVLDTGAVKLAQYNGFVTVSTATSISGAKLTVQGGTYINGTVTATNFVGSVTGLASSTALTNTYVGYGSGSNTLTGSSSLTWNGTSFYVNGNVGIGVTAPATKLSNTATRHGNADGLSAHLNSIQWEVSGQGYTSVVSNIASSGGNYNAGLLVKLGSTDVTDKILDLESGGVNRVRVLGNGSVTFTGAVTHTGAGVFLNRNGSTTSGISWYSSSYTSWSSYMAAGSQTSVGPTGNLTASTGAYVTSWALRNFVENNGGYGFIWESGTNSGQPSTIAELRSSDGLFHAYGNIYKYNSPSGGYMVPAISISDTAPSGTVSVGDMWWQSSTGRLKIRYFDGTNTQWVDTVPVIDTSLFFSKSGGAISGPVSINGTLDVTGNITSTAEITAYYSDRRLKTDIITIENALVKVKKLNGVTYRPNELAKSFGLDTNSDVVGLFADEVEEVLPQAVKPAPFDIDKNGNSKSGENYKTIQYEKVVPLLVEAIKEQQSIIEAQQAKIDRLMKHLELED